MESRKTYFADVVLPVALPQLFTYRVPMELTDEVRPGMRAIVQFGKNKLYTAIIRSVHETAPKNYEAKYIESLLDERPIVTEAQMLFWEWMSNYYCCTVGEVMTAAIPGSLRLASETKVIHSGVIPDPFPELNAKEQTIYDALENKGEITIAEIAALLDQKTVQQHVRSLIEKGLVTVAEELKYRYRPKYETVISLAQEYFEEEKLKAVFHQLEKDKRAGKRVEALLLFIQLSGIYAGKYVKVRKSELVKGIGGQASPVDTLIRNGIFETEEVRVDRLALSLGEIAEMPQLSTEQHTAFESIRYQFSEKDTVLLHGVTGSGKTEIYIRLIEEYIEQGKQVLYLLPEIALTTQIINRLRKYFGDKVGVYHSRFNEQERAEIWAKTIKGEYSVLLGARSSLFLPFVKLGLVIVDEEHENTFKQFDPAPRYHARDSAIVMASMFRAKTLLGSATPSIDSYFNAKSGKYGFTELLKRFGGIQLPEVQCIDLKTSAKRKEMKESFSDTLLEHIRNTIENGEQIILFQNRRGYTPQWICETCGWVPKCKHCDVSLTYHKAVHQLQCHYCSTVYPPPKSCQACGSHHLKMAGFGTEKIEEDLTTLIPGLKVARMDLDSTRSKNAYVQILSDFEDRKIDVLVGTQMVTKGLDFDHVGLVGILNADNMLNFPDFRAFERSYQLIAQVSGRAGRKNKRGLVQIQTWNPNHWVIQKVMQNDYLGLYHQEIIERKNFQYPPFVKLIKLTIRNKDQNLIESATKALGERIRPLLQKRLLGPEKPAIPRIRNYYYRTFLIKIERGSSYPQLKKELYESIREFRASKEGKNTFVDIDVDPQ